jgi:hypothetical protein
MRCFFFLVLAEGISCSEGYVVKRTDAGVFVSYDPGRRRRG